MNPDNGHLIQVDHAEQMTTLKKEGYEPLPERLQLEAKLELMGKKQTFVGLHSTGSLARRAKKIRQERREAKLRLKELQERLQAL